jgi:hypothetical protein
MAPGKGGLGCRSCPSKLMRCWLSVSCTITEVLLNEVGLTGRRAGFGVLEEDD